ncbi:MAG: MBL fold metallo-hydrolase [Gemmatimonadetes bacterium]|nr:MBL fold metallo-hydrolase [Gemmatimonadota bacterium]
MPGRSDAEGGARAPAPLPGPLPEPHILVAPNPGPFTLDGTRTYLVGRKRVAVVDPGPDVEGHVRAVLHALGDADAVTILLTHGHRDHAAAAPALAAKTNAPVLGRAAVADRALRAGERIETDGGALVAVETPGHSPDHLAFHWPAGAAVFAGDLVLGIGDTTYVGAPEGDVAAYLRSLAVVEALRVRRIYPGHGPPVEDVSAALARFAAHRMARVQQVREALGGMPGASPAELARAIYPGELPEPLRTAAERSMLAILEYLRVHGADEPRAAGTDEGSHASERGDGSGGAGRAPSR